VLSLGASAYAFADCPDYTTGGTRPEASVVYNADFKVFQYCDGTNWRSMMGGAATDPSSPTLSDVDDALAPADGNVLTYDSASGNWKAGTAGIGVEDDPQVGTLTGSKWCASNAGGTVIDCTQNVPAGDDLGSHSATQNVQLNGYWLSGDGDNEGMRVDSDGDVGIGAPTIIGAKLGVQADSAVSGSDVVGVRIFGAQSVANTGTYYALTSGPAYAANSGTLATLIGGFFAPKNAAAGTVSTLTEVHAAPKNDGSGPASAVYGVLSAPEKSGTGAVTSTYGFYTKCKNSNAAGAISNCYGLFLDTPVTTGGISNKYGVYQTDNASKNYFAGNVGIANNNPGYELDVSGTVRASAYLYASDARLKTDIQTLDGLPLIEKLRGVSFTWKATGKPATGVIAQEVERVFPAAVSTDDQGMKAVDYQQRIGPLIEAVKALKAENDDLRARVQDLEADAGQRQ
jgi:hypothetical protein